MAIVWWIFKFKQTVTSPLCIYTQTYILEGGKRDVRSVYFARTCWMWFTVLCIIFWIHGVSLFLPPLILSLELSVILKLIVSINFNIECPKNIPLISNNYSFDEYLFRDKTKKRLFVICSQVLGVLFFLFLFSNVYNQKNKTNSIKTKMVLFFCQ